MRKVDLKADLSLQVVVVAAICILVLVVLTLIFTGRMTNWSEGMKACNTVCKATAKECTDSGYSDIPVYLDSCKDNDGSSFKGYAYCCKQKV